ncbi:hypothetical protein EV175_006911, partial [Coemansia sp. RSA 1933]
MPQPDTTEELDVATHTIASSLRAISQSLKQCADRMGTASGGTQLQEALRLLYRTSDTTGGKVVFTGVGKSYLVGKKLAATMTSTGTPSVCIHATDAVHGDLGIIGKGDCVVLLSYSGATDEVVRLATVLRSMRGNQGTACVALVAMSGALPHDAPLGR